MKDIPVIFVSTRFTGTTEMLQAAPAKLRNPGLDKTPLRLIRDAVDARPHRVTYMDADLGDWCTFGSETGYADLLDGIPLFCVVVDPPASLAAPRETRVGFFGQEGHVCRVLADILDLCGSARASTGYGHGDALIPKGFRFYACKDRGACPPVDIAVLVTRGVGLIADVVSEFIRAIQTHEEQAPGSKMFVVVVDSDQIERAAWMSRLAAPYSGRFFFQGQQPEKLRAAVLG